MSINAIGHTGICVSDMETALRFWRDGLGFEVLTERRFRGSSWKRILEVGELDLLTRIIRRDHLMLELLEFRLASERYAVESRLVQEVHPLRDLTPLPCTPPFVLGIVNVRGRILPVLDLKKFFDLPERGLTDLHRIILVRGNDLELP